jgi:hypothetical protein
VHCLHVDRTAHHRADSFAVDERVGDNSQYVALGYQAKEKFVRNMKIAKILDLKMRDSVRKAKLI